MKKRKDISVRVRILRAAYEEMYQHGFQGLRIDAVLKKTQLAKGALYHYFPNKLALGYAVVDECIMVYFQTTWCDILTKTLDPLLAIQCFLQKECSDLQVGNCFNGCPLNNLIQEMSALDQGFSHRLQAVTLFIIASVTAALEQGQDHAIVRTDINPRKIAIFILSSYQGIMGTVKCMQSPEAMADLVETLGAYVESLRVQHG